MRSKAERLEKLNHSQRQSLEEKQRKEDRLIMQYDKLLEQLRSEIKEKERELHAQDTRGAYAKQEVVKQLQEVQLKLEFSQEKLSAKESSYLVQGSELQRLKEENLMLKASVREGDKNREVLARQMTQAMKQEMQMMHYSPENNEDRRERQPLLGSPYAPVGAHGEPLELDGSEGEVKKTVHRPGAPHSKDLQRSTETLQ